MSNDESNQSIKKIFNQYQIKLMSNKDYINILIHNNNTFNIYESKFNLEYLHLFKLLMGNLTINEMINFIIILIKKLKKKKIIFKININIKNNNLS